MVQRFAQIDVFTATAYCGNPVAVVHDADGVDDVTMRRIANWTNLSETTFLLTPTDPGADYRVRIFTPVAELPFAGHPTLGTCHAWLSAGGTPRADGTVVQQCAVGLITIRSIDGRLAFGAPPVLRTGPVDDALVDTVLAALALDRAQLVAAEWVDNGPGWMALLLESPEAVLAARPSFVDQDLGLAAIYPPGGGAALEVRTFFPKHGALVEDPVTGSFNASVAQWLIATDRLAAPYVAAQGTAVGRSGRIHVSQDDTGQIWVGGDTVTCIEGSIDV